MTLAVSLHLLEVLNSRLVDVPYLGGNGYSIADAANYTWARTAVEELLSEEPEAVENLSALQDWLTRVGERRAVQIGMSIPTDEHKHASAERAPHPAKGPASGGTVEP